MIQYVGHRLKPPWFTCVRCAALPYPPFMIGVMACSIHTAAPPRDHIPNVPADSMRTKALFFKVHRMPSATIPVHLSFFWTSSYPKKKKLAAL